MKGPLIEFTAVPSNGSIMTCEEKIFTLTTPSPNIKKHILMIMLLLLSVVKCKRMAVYCLAECYVLTSFLFT